MNRLPRMLILCLAGGFVVASGCKRNEPNQPEAASEPVSQARQSGFGEQPEQLYVTNANIPQLLVSTTPSQPKPDQRIARPGGSKKQQADAIFDEPTLLRIQIEIPQSGLNALRQTRWENGQQRPVARATVREGGLVYSNVAVHLKGAAGSFRQIDNKPGLTLKFDKFVPEQNFHGLHKISLNNSEQDKTFLCEKIGRELFIAAGVPVPRASHATVELNGRALGLYVLLEGANKQFLKRFFNNPKGNLYDGGFCRDIGSRLKADSGEDPNNHSGLKALKAAVRDSSVVRLEQALDMERFLSMVALEMMLGHWDGYSMNKNNWRLYHDTEFNRMVFIPHGMDQLFGAGRPLEQNGSLIPQQIQGEVTRAVLADRQVQRRYRARVLQIYTNIFKADAMIARVEEVVAGVSRELAETDPQAARAFERRAGSLKQRIIRRSEGLRQELGLPLDPVEFGSKGLLTLAGWKPSIVISGEPVLSEAQDPAGKSILVVNAGDSPSSGSWRKRTILGPGSYVFEGRVRVVGVTVADGDERSGAGLRISKGVMPRKLAGTSDWRDYKYPFEVGANGADVELICELKASSGEAWFDASSLRLTRVE